jgi:hypothetical protein
MKIDHISFSDIDTYYNCGLKYQLSKLNPIRTYSIPTELGSILHHALMLRFTIQDDNSFLDELSMHIGTKLNDYKEPEPIIYNYIITNLEQIMNWLINSSNKFHVWFKDIYPTYEVFDKEKNGFEDLLYEHIKNTEVKFKGFRDFTFYNIVNNKYMINIWDFKSSKEWWSDYNINSLMKKSQLGYYKYFLAQKLMKEGIIDFEIDTKFVNFKLFENDFKIYDADLSKNDMEQIIQTLKGVINGIEKDMFIAVGNHCKICNRPDCTKRKYTNQYF